MGSMKTDIMKILTPSYMLITSTKPLIMKTSAQNSMSTTMRMIGNPMTSMIISMSLDQMTLIITEKITTLSTMTMITMAMKMGNHMTMKLNSPTREIGKLLPSLLEETSDEKNHKYLK